MNITLNVIANVIYKQFYKFSYNCIHDFKLNLHYNIKREHVLNNIYNIYISPNLLLRKGCIHVTEHTYK